MQISYPVELKFSQVGRNKDNKPSRPHWMLRAGLEHPAQRRALVYACLKALAVTPTVKAVVVGVDQRRCDRNRSPILHAVKPLFERINLDCQDFGTHGLAVFDEEQADDKKLREATRSGSFYMAFERIVDAISFMPSDESVGVQMADLVAGAFNRYLNRNDAEYARHAWPILRCNRDGRVHGYGIKIFPNGQCPDLPAAPAFRSGFEQQVADFEAAALRIQTGPKTR